MVRITDVSVQKVDDQTPEARGLKNYPHANGSDLKGIGISKGSILQLLPGETSCNRNVVGATWGLLIWSRFGVELFFQRFAGDFFNGKNVAA